MLAASEPAAMICLRCASCAAVLRVLAGMPGPARLPNWDRRRHGRPAMTIRVALDRLNRALGLCDVPRPATPATLQPLADVEAAIAPLRLPEEVAAFWRSVDPWTVRAFPPVPFYRVEELSSAWRLQVDTVEFDHPPVLFPISYDSHVYRGVELDDADRRGGAVFEWAGDDGHDSYRLISASLTDTIDEMAAMVERGEGQRIQAPDPGFRLDEDAWYENCARRLHDNPHPVYGSAANFPFQDPHTWPPHWRP